jgi:uncharacterized protein (DUF2384 family)
MKFREVHWKARIQRRKHNRIYKSQISQKESKHIPKIAEVWRENFYEALLSDVEGLESELDFHPPT